MTRDVFTRIREAAAEVTRRARTVRIDEARLAVLAAGLRGEPVPPPQLDPAHHHLGEEAATVAYVVSLDALNFGSGWFPYLAKRPGLSGYYTVATCLKERFEKRGAWDAGELESVDAAECTRLFGQPADVPEVAELMELFAQALRDLGAFLRERHAGDFAGPVREASGSAARLVEILAAMPFYRDVLRYDELEVPFYKRAQLTAADLAAAFRGRGPGRFRDLERLTIFADNLVPHVLRREGVLVYAPELAERVDRQELLPAGSHEEIEIRAVALHAVERCVEELRAAGQPARAHELDFLLWRRGQRPEHKAHPRHRTRCTYY